MFGRCKHQWVTGKINYTPPTNMIKSVNAWGSGQNQALDAFRKDTEGFTVVSLKCSKCGDVSTRQFYGRYEE